MWFRQNTWKGWLQQNPPLPFHLLFSSCLSPRGARRFCPVASRIVQSLNVQSLFCSDQPALSGTENLAEWYAIESVILPGDMKSSGGAI